MAGLKDGAARHLRARRLHDIYSIGRTLTLLTRPGALLRVCGSHGIGDCDRRVAQR